MKICCTSGDYLLMERLLLLLLLNLCLYSMVVTRQEAVRYTVLGFFLQFCAYYVKMILRKIISLLVVFVLVFMDWWLKAFYFFYSFQALNIFVTWCIFHFILKWVILWNWIESWCRFFSVWHKFFCSKIICISLLLNI